MTTADDRVLSPKTKLKIENRKSKIKNQKSYAATKRRLFYYTYIGSIIAALYHT